jgi:hypothetical protein
MSSIYSLILLNTDQRVEERAITKMKVNGTSNILKTCIIMLIGFITLLFICYLVPVNLYFKALIVGKTVITTLANLINIKRHTAIRTRIGNIKYFATVFLNTINLMSIRVAGTYNYNDMNEVLLIQVNNEINRMNKPWDVLDKQMMPHKNYEINDYWQQLGLTQHQLQSKTKCIRLGADEPLHKNIIRDYCIDIREILNPDSIIVRKSVDWMRSDISDKMHVKSIYKRLCPKKGKINIKNIKRMDEITSELTPLLGNETKKYEDKIISALSTSGTAGQFAKGSSYEEIWKNAQNMEATDIWNDLSKDILNSVYLNNKMEEDLVQYMLYRKKEAVNSSNGVPKETRVMNAPNLVSRIVDSITFSEYNDALIKAREIVPSSLGMNIFLEMKLIHIRDKRKVYITCDFADYDGSQHPAQGYIAAKSRIMYNIQHNKDEKMTSYILPKYKEHMIRRVKSTSGIYYDVIGQQASGDITTSDDNTLKTTAVMVMILIELVKQEQIVVKNKDNFDLIYEIEEGTLGIDITSDDSGLVVIPSDKFDEIIVSKIYKQVVESVGWYIKQESFSINIMGDNTLDYLSHGVSDRFFATNEMKTMMEFRVLKRPEGKQWGKFCISPEIDNILNTENKSKLMSKYMTLTMVSLGSPLMMLMSLKMMLIFRSTATDHKGSYSWAGIKAETIDALELNRCIQLQLGSDCTDRFDWIEIQDNEKIDFEIGIKEFEEQLVKVDRLDMRIQLDTNRMKVIYNGKFWNYRSTLKIVQSVFNKLDKHGLISAKKDDDKWWNNKENKDGEYKPGKTNIIGGITKCDHLSNNVVDKFSCKNKYGLRILCSQCYEIRTEKRYECVNIKYIE